MQHHDYQTITSVMKKFCNELKIPIPVGDELARFHENVLQMADPSSRALMMLHLDFDTLWQQQNQPYYLLYPSILPLLTKLKLDKVTGDNITLPHGLQSLLLRFPVGGELRSVWLCHRKIRHSVGSDVVCRGLVIGIDHGELDATGNQPVYLIRAFPLDSRPVEESLDALPASWTASTGKQLDPQEVANAVRIACMLCLMGNDPDLVQPEVLSKDLPKLTPDRLDDMVARARRRGKVGWTVGREFESCPHYRRSHPALMWTGVGRTVPRIVMRKGTIVHREKVTQIPTGYGAVK